MGESKRGKESRSSARAITSGSSPPPPPITNKRFFPLFPGSQPLGEFFGGYDLSLSVADSHVSRSFQDTAYFSSACIVQAGSRPKGKSNFNDLSFVYARSLFGIRRSLSADNSLTLPTAISFRCNILPSYSSGPAVISTLNWRFPRYSSMVTRSPTFRSRPVKLAAFRDLLSINGHNDITGFQPGFGRRTGEDTGDQETLIYRQIDPISLSSSFLLASSKGT